MKIFVALLLTLALYGGAFPFETAQPIQDCGSPLATITKLEINPPCQTDVCVLKRGERVTVSAEFIPKVHAKDLFIIGYSRDPVFGYEANLFKESICTKQFNVTCPVEANKPVPVYFNEIISPNSPPNRFVIKMIITTETGHRLMCKTANMEIR